MQAALFIPWFRLEPLKIPLPFSLPVLGDSLELQPFGALVLIGILSAAYIARRYAEREGRSGDLAVDLVFYLVLYGLVTSYFANGLFYEIDVVKEMFRDPTLLWKRWLGLSSFGGFAGAMLGAWVWRRKRQEKLLPYLDAAAFCMPVGWMFGRMGCFVVHDHPGRPTDFPLAVADYVFGAPPYVPRHDLGLYEVIFAFCIALLFFWLRRKPRPIGFYVAWLPIIYTPVRFMLDFLRAPAVEGGDTRVVGLTPAQYFAVFFFIVGILMLRYVNKHAHDDPITSTTPP